MYGWVFLSENKCMDGFFLSENKCMGGSFLVRTNVWMGLS
jgi:hypothetical protein